MAFFRVPIVDFLEKRSPNPGRHQAPETDILSTLPSSPAMSPTPHLPHGEDQGRGYLLPGGERPGVALQRRGAHLQRDVHGQQHARPEKKPGLAPTSAAGPQMRAGP